MSRSVHAAHRPIRPGLLPALWEPRLGKNISALTFCPLDLIDLIGRILQLFHKLHGGVLPYH
jgi:hypothetical protein